jgi:hypothetical protein
MFLDNEATHMAVRSSSAWQARAICLLDKHRQHTLGTRACLKANRRPRQQERRSQHAERVSCDTRRKLTGCWPHRVPRQTSRLLRGEAYSANLHYYASSWCFQR